MTSVYLTAKLFSNGYIHLSTHMIIIAEIKNYSGTLIFDPVFKQVIRILDEKEEALPNPVIQVKRQIAQFKQWLAMNKLPDLPIEPLVLIANGRAVLKMNQSNYEIPKIVSTLYDFPNKIKNLEKQHPEPVITKADVNKIMRRLLKQHQPNTQDLFSIYGISKNKVKKGSCVKLVNSFRWTEFTASGNAGNVAIRPSIAILRHCTIMLCYLTRNFNSSGYGFYK